MATEKQIQINTYGLTKLTTINFVSKILHTVKQDLALDDKIFPDVICDTEPLDIPHKIRLINAISYRYLKIRLFTYGKFVQEILRPNRKRHRLSKQILFQMNNKNKHK